MSVRWPAPSWKNTDHPPCRACRSQMRPPRPDTWFGVSRLRSMPRATRRRRRYHRRGRPRVDRCNCAPTETASDFGRLDTVQRATPQNVRTSRICSPCPTARWQLGPRAGMGRVGGVGFSGGAWCTRARPPGANVRARSVGSRYVRSHPHRARAFAPPRGGNTRSQTSVRSAQAWTSKQHRRACGGDLGLGCVGLPCWRAWVSGRAR